MIVVDWLVRLFLLGCLLWSLSVFARAAVENHYRGRAPIHRGQSWQPRVPRQQARR